MTFSIIHPSIRPKKWREIYDAWIAAAEHPENVQYVLAVDSGWGFPVDSPKLRLWEEERHCAPETESMFVNQLFFSDNLNYVASVNEAAKRAAGDVLVVIADDIWPVKGWDKTLLDPLRNLAARLSDVPPATGSAEFAIWVNNGWNEQGRGIMAMPVLSRSRFERLGYIYFPGYESMWADADMAHHVMLDAAKGLCSLIKLTEPVFEHKHPSFDGSVPVDDQYRKQNRVEAYNLGQRLFNARKHMGFPDIGDWAREAIKNLDRPQRRKRIAVCVAGESFPIAWVARWTEIIELGAREHDMNIVFNMGSSTNVYQMRMQMARNVLSIEPADYVLWIDNDQLVEPEQIQRLVSDLEENPDVHMVAGWTVCGADTFSTQPQLSFELKVKWPGMTSVHQMKDQPSDLMEVAYTGFPLVLMRGELLAKVGPGAFWPEKPSDGKLPDGEDVAFCKAAIAAGFQVCVDRRVGPLPHLKLRDIAAGVLG